MQVYTMISILYEDSMLLAAVKPAGILSQSSPQEAESMLSLLSAQCGGTVYPVHRLDRDTGGVMVFARTQPAAAALSEAMARREVGKIYCCMVSGCPQPERGILRDLLYTDRNRGKTFVVTRMRKGVKEAELAYEVLAAGPEKSLLRVALHTGRTHQIRVQFASRRLPLAGDSRYGGGRGALALWCASLDLRHPADDRPMAFFAPPEAEIWAPYAGELGEERLRAPFPALT